MACKSDWQRPDIRRAMAFRVVIHQNELRFAPGPMEVSFLHCRTAARTGHSRPSFQLSSDPEGVQVRSSGGHTQAWPGGARLLVMHQFLFSGLRSNPPGEDARPAANHAYSRSLDPWLAHVPHPTFPGNRCTTHASLPSTTSTVALLRYQRMHRQRDCIDGPANTWRLCYREEAVDLNKTPGACDSRLQSS